MANVQIDQCRLVGVSSCVPGNRIDNQSLDQFDPKEIRKVSAMAGVKSRHVVSEGQTSLDLCVASAKDLLSALDWSNDSIDGLIFITQTPDHFLPSSSCIIHEALELSEHCATFDVGLGCSGYPYGLWLGAMMIKSGSAKRLLVLHGETPSVFTHPEDRSTVLLFGDAGSATALEFDTDAPAWSFNLQTDGRGKNDLVIPNGAFRNRFNGHERDFYLHMNGTNLFNFTIKRVPPLIEDTLALSQHTLEDVDAFIFHQSNRFIMKHLANKCDLPDQKVPIILENFGNTGGPSVPLTLTQWGQAQEIESDKTLMLLGYGVGLSWSSALLQLAPDTLFLHSILD